MDRSDEYDREERTGDILGLGAGPVPKSPGDPSTEPDPESAGKRRERVRSTDDEGPNRRTPQPTPGATGIDMGAGGTGTDVSGE
jgi:hypothetical protein